MMSLEFLNTKDVKSNIDWNSDYSGQPIFVVDGSRFSAEEFLAAYEQLQADLIGKNKFDFVDRNNVY